MGNYKEVDVQMVIKFRDDLVKYGQRVVMENPDRLNQDQMQALIADIFKRVAELDQSFGFEPHDTGLRPPKGITETQIMSMFVNFLDWYEILDTPSADVLRFVTKNYKPDEYPRILCVGDGENCHLGRKLAMRGYNAISIDPVARTEYSTIGSQTRKTGEGKLHVVREYFTQNSNEMINWASAIVGSKVPLCAETLIGQPKPAVFTISNNAEIHHMRFRGQAVYTSQQLTDMIIQCSNVSVKGEREGLLLFSCNERQRAKTNPNPKGEAGEER